MSSSNGFTIYNASAGSGKTFTVVKNYLKILFQSTHPLAFKSVLALTFTNKAVGEMKERVIEMLKTFSSPNIIEKPNSMFGILVKELDTEPEVLHKKAITILNSIVHNYASFDISTIDKFNHKLIRTFAYDLNLPVNFEVELDTNEVLNKAVDKLIDKAGTNQELTKVLVDFAIEKADDDRSWDIAYDFNAIAKLWIDENQIPFLETIKDKSLDDFKSLKTQVVKRIRVLEIGITELAQNTLELIVNHGFLGYRLYKALQAYGGWRVNPGGWRVYLGVMQLFGPWTAVEGPWKQMQIDTPTTYQKERLADQQWVFQAHQDHIHVAR
jgi:ATP-dependent exoDNAse (exonuclease V) beta subunit